MADGSDIGGREIKFGTVGGNVKCSLKKDNEEKCKKLIEKAGDGDLLKDNPSKNLSSSACEERNNVKLMGDKEVISVKPEVYKEISSLKYSEQVKSVSNSEVEKYFSDSVNSEGRSSGKNSIKEMVELFETVSGSGRPNFQGCRVRIPASSNLNIDLWRRSLLTYEDKIICDLLEFGFPLDFDRTHKLDHDVRRNH